MTRLAPERRQARTLVERFVVPHALGPRLAGARRPDLPHRGRGGAAGGGLQRVESDNPRERFWASRTAQLHRAHVTTFDRLWSCLPYLRPMLTITATPSSTAATRTAPAATTCSARAAIPYVHKMLNGEEFDLCCHTNLMRAVRPYRLTELDVHDVLNIFQVTGLTAEGTATSSRRARRARATSSSSSPRSTCSARSRSAPTAICPSRCGARAPAIGLDTAGRSPWRSGSRRPELLARLALAAPCRLSRRPRAARDLSRAVDQRTGGCRATEEETEHAAETVTIPARRGKAARVRKGPAHHGHQYPRHAGGRHLGVQRARSHGVDVHGGQPRVVPEAGGPPSATRSSRTSAGPS